MPRSRLGLDFKVSISTKCNKRSIMYNVRCLQILFPRVLSPCLRPKFNISARDDMTELRLATDRNVRIRTSIVAASSITVDLRLVWPNWPALQLQAHSALPSQHALALYVFNPLLSVRDVYSFTLHSQWQPQYRCPRKSFLPLYL